MYAGKIMELGARSTCSRIRSIRHAGPGRRLPDVRDASHAVVDSGSRSQPHLTPAGCEFHRDASSRSNRCTAAEPALAEVTPRRRAPASCIRSPGACPLVRSQRRRDPRPAGLKSGSRSDGVLLKDVLAPGRLGQGGLRDRPRRRRREILCLVGESGCGRRRRQGAPATREPTDGDVLFEMPDADYRRSRTLGITRTPAQAATLEDLRRRYSFTGFRTTHGRRGTSSRRPRDRRRGLSRADVPALLSRCSSNRSRTSGWSSAHRSSSVRLGTWDPCRPRDQPDARPHSSRSSPS